ncbi:MULTISPECIES: elongator complex protein 3 [Cetobacterium]|uniref:Radical SAM protein n=1 Tax=Candidatus Cetobacterium colombiensis TaxID=3073100 RepID=A0ABU4WBY4_9FUSO|nr:radical SAM protein [Candidatus Cetobacterium colombiensis]MDX8336665.1 radical SAM protein [Candidatus Cetobacterium colombiensis]
MKHYNIPIFISHFGCPNDCVFCNQKKINGRETDVTTEDIKNIIETYLKTLPKKSKKEVAFFGGTFTGISIKLQEEYLSVVYEYIKNGLIDGIRLSTRPDYIDDEIVKMLKKYGVTTVELGVQSLDEQVLLKTHRFYPIEKVYTASKLIKEAGIELGIQLMIGLPGSTDESDYLSALKTVEINPDIARIYPTLIIKETEMADMFKKGSYIPLTIEEAVKRCKKIYSLLDYNEINIIRVGLQPTEELNDSENVLGGPFHPAFRELVVGEIYYDFLKKIYEDEKKIEVEINEKNVSKVVGINKINREKFGKNLKIKIDNTLSLNAIKVNDKMYSWKQVLRGEEDEPNNNKHQ